MTHTLTQDGAIVLAAFATAALSLLLYIQISARRNNGIAVLPDFLFFGFWGAAWSPSILLIAKSQTGNTALIAHEQCHQMQQRRDGTLTFWWRYLTDKRKRLNYEIEAYRVWIDVSPQDRRIVLWWLTHNYNAGLSGPQIEAMLTEDTHGATRP